MDHQATTLALGWQSGAYTMHATAAEPGAERASFSDMDSLNLHMTTHFSDNHADDPLAVPHNNALPVTNNVSVPRHNMPIAPLHPTGPPPRLTCTFASCGRTFARSADLQRHAQKHNPNARKFDCWAPGCAYNGAKGFLRRDKLRSHQRSRHGAGY